MSNMETLGKRRASCASERAVPGLKYALVRRYRAAPSRTPGANTTKKFGWKDVPLHLPDTRYSGLQALAADVEVS